MTKACGAKTRTGGTCKQPALANGRCRFHGGKTPGGIASPHFKTGRYSKYLPARLSDRYHESLTDPDLLELRSEIAVLDARMGELIERIDTGESGAAWVAARLALQQYNESELDGDKAKKVAAMRQLEEALERGAADYAIWSEIAAMTEQRRKLVESERKRLVDMQQVITSDRAMLLIGAVVDIIRRNVTDRGMLSGINRELTALLNRPEAQPAALAQIEG